MHGFVVSYELGMTNQVPDLGVQQIQMIGA